jgi:hypothetical protein
VERGKISTSEFLPHLGQVEARERFLLQHSHGFAVKRALHRLHDAVDLGHAEEGEAVELPRGLVATGGRTRR